MFDANVMPYGDDDERNSLIDNDGFVHYSSADLHASMRDDERDDDAPVAETLDPIAYYGPVIGFDVSASGVHGMYVHGDTPGYRRTGITDQHAAGWDDAPQAMHTAAAVDDVMDRTPPIPQVNKREGMRLMPLPPTDPHSAVFGWPEASVHSDAFDSDDANRPRNGLGTYFESDAS